MTRIFIFFIGLGALLWFLTQQFPSTLDQTGNRMEFAQRSLVLVLIIGSSLAARSLPLGQTAKYGAIWCAILGILVLAYSYREPLMQSRLIAELTPSRPQKLADGSLQLKAGEGGHFYVQGLVNGKPTRFLLDTGATEIVLSPADAQRAGYDIQQMKFDRSANTANGIGGGARVHLTQLDIGGIMLQDIPAIVNQAEMNESLLGMTFLAHFRSYRVEGSTLTLTP